MVVFSFKSLLLIYELHFVIFTFLVFLLKPLERNAVYIRMVA